MEEEKPEKKYDEVDFDSAIEDFGEETVQFCVAAFLDKTYKELKSNIPKLYKSQNYKELRGKMHILKTNSGYMGAANFSALCKEFETSCKFESLNEEKIDELYPIFMTNLDKLYNKIKKLNKEKFESPEEPEPAPEPEAQKEKEEPKENKEEKEKKEAIENKQNSENNFDKKENTVEVVGEKKEKTVDTEDKKEIIEKKEKDEIKDKNIVNNIDENKNKEKEGEKINYQIKIIRADENQEEKKIEDINDEIKEEYDEEESGNLIELKTCPKESTKEATYKESTKEVACKETQSSSNKNIVVNNEMNNPNNNAKNLMPKHSLAMKKIVKFRNLSSSNIHEYNNLKEGNEESFRGNPKYKNILQSFQLTEEETKHKTENKALHSPKHALETEKHKVLNRVKLGFSTMDKNEIRDCLKRYDIAVLKNSATLVKENLIKFLNGDFPLILNDFNNYLMECDLSKKKEIIDKINIIISNMKYLSDNYNIYFFRVNERLEICKDKEKFKVILTKLIQKLHMLEEELTIIYKVKIKKDDTFLTKLGYLQDSNFTKNSKKNVDSLYNYRSKENNNEQIEGLKKNLGINKEGKNSRKKLKHFPYSFKDQKLFSIEDKKQIHASFKSLFKEGSNKIINESEKNLFSDFEKQLPKYMDLFKESITNKNKDQLIQVISEFKTEIVKKYGFSNLVPTMDKWVEKINKGQNFDDLNANIEDIAEVINFMKQDMANKNIENINREEESQENEDYYFDEENKNDKNEEAHLGKEDLALYSQLRQFNAASFFQPKNQGISQHKFKLKVEKIIRETTGNENEILQNNKNSNYNLVEKISSHIVLSQNFRTKKNKLIGFSYPFKEDTFLNNCLIF